MKQFVFAVLLFVGHSLNAEEIHPRPYLETLSPLPPAIDKENLDHITTYGPENEKQLHIYVAEHTFPWKSVGFCLVVLLLILIIRPWVSHYVEKRKTQFIPKSRRQLMQELYQKHLTETEIYDRIATVVRERLEGIVGERMSSMTVPELTLIIQQTKDIPPDLKQSVSNLLFEAEQVRFAHYLPTKQQCQNAHHLALQFVKV